MHVVGNQTLRREEHHHLRIRVKVPVLSWNSLLLGCETKRRSLKSWIWHLANLVWTPVHHLAHLHVERIIMRTSLRMMPIVKIGLRLSA